MPTKLVLPHRDWNYYLLDETVVASTPESFKN